MTPFKLSLFFVLISTATIRCDNSVEDEVTFYLFTETLNDTELYRDNLNVIDISLPTVIIIHGWETSSNDSWVINLTDAYLSTGNYNIITVDWSAIANLLYPLAVAGVKPVGEYTGELILNLQKNYGADLSSFHVVGHSLGAHVAGFAGKTVQNATGGAKLGRITGLDPALALYLLKSSKDSLAETDADLVVAVHTAGGTIGDLRPRGDIDFYANGGTPEQPGCSVGTDCSHKRSAAYLTESVYNPNGFWSTECDSYLKYLLGKCSENRNVTLGGNLSVEDAGQYYFTTNAEKPYSKQ